MRRIVLLVSLLILAPGCFVFDELDAGSEIMDQHAPKTDAERQQSAAPKRSAGAAERDEGLLEGVQGWIAKKKKPSARASRPTVDPDDVPVRCESGGRTQYMRKSDCRLRGGTIL